MKNMKQIFSEPNTTGRYCLVDVLNDKSCKVKLLNVGMLAAPSVIIQILTMGNSKHKAK
jgi:hypothetical protein